jgi:hypothetical protein
VRDGRRQCRVSGSNDEIQSMTTAMSRKIDKLSKVNYCLLDCFFSHNVLFCSSTDQVRPILAQQRLRNLRYIACESCGRGRTGYLHNTNFPDFQGIHYFFIYSLTMNSYRSGFLTMQCAWDVVNCWSFIMTFHRMNSGWRLSHSSVDAT